MGHIAPLDDDGPHPDDKLIAVAKLRTGGVVLSVAPSHTTRVDPVPDAIADEWVDGGLGAAARILRSRGYTVGSWRKHGTEPTWRYATVTPTR
jgi:hypothetical protein